MIDLTSYERNALVGLYRAGGGETLRVDYNYGSSIQSGLYDKGCIKSHRNLCHKYAYYELTPVGIEAAANLLGE